MAKTRQTNVNINYTVNTVDVERGNALLTRVSKTTDDLRKSTDAYTKQAASGYRFTSKTIEGMSIEVARLKQQVKLASVQNTADVQRLSAQYRSAKTQLDAYNKSLLETSRASKETAASARGMAAQFGDVYNSIRAIIAAGLAKELVATTLEMAKLSGTVEGVEQAFNRLPNAQLLLHSLREATHGAVNDLELMQKALRANNFKIPLQQLGVLLEFASVKAQQTGQEVNHLVEYIVSGIGYRSIKRLDDLGFTANRVNKALGDVSLQAASMGEIMTAVTKLMNEDLQQTGGYVETSATRVDQLSKKLHDLRVMLSERLTSSWILDLYDAILTGAQDLVASFPSKALEELFSLNWKKLNPILTLGQITDVFAEWQIQLKDVANQRMIDTNAAEEAARIQAKLTGLTKEQTIPLLDKEIKMKQQVADEYFYQIQAIDMTVDKYSEENIARKLNLREIEATIKLLKDLRKAQDLATDTTDDEGKPVRKGMPRPLKQVVDIRFRNPKTGAISKENFDKIMDDLGPDAQAAVQRLSNVIGSLQIPITPIILMSDWERAWEDNKEAITDLGLTFVSDQMNSILQADIDQYNQRIDAARAFYDEQIELAGDNERAKQELRIKEEREIKRLEKERADREKKAAKAGILVSTALGIMKVFAGDGTFVDKIIRAAIVAAQGASQLAVASRARYYAKGEINIKGGVQGKDSIPAMLMPGESIMTTKETETSGGILKAVRAKKLNDRVLGEIISGRSGGSLQSSFDDSRILKKLDEVKNATPDLVRRANLIYETRQMGDNYRRTVRSKRHTR